MSNLRLALAFCAVLSFTASSFAQTTSGSISGSVLDATQARVPNAIVTATEEDKRFSLTTKTDPEGRFVFPIVQAGRYAISAESPGFKKTERRDVILQGNEKLFIGTLQMEVGTVAESIEVNAQAVQLQTESGERSQTINSKQMENIALNSRSYLPLVALTPGVTTIPSLQTAGHGGVGSISSNGNRQNQNNLTLDGVGNVDTGNNGDQLATLSLDSVQEFRVLTSNYQAEYGRSSGMQISVITKSGTSDFHGSGYWYHRHEGLNANNWKNNRDGQPLKKQRYNDPGYTIGGPVFIPKLFNRNKDKLFFFFSQEYQRQLNPQGTKNQTVPTDLERQGDFSQSLDKNGNPWPYIRDYTTGLPCGATNTSGCFADGGVLGRIPKSRIYGPGLAILNLYPKANFITGANGLPNKGFNQTSQISDAYPRREDLLRGDWNLSDKWKIFARWINNFDAVTSYYGSFVLGTNFPRSPIKDARPGRAFAVSVTTLISPTVTNEATWGFGKNIINIDPTQPELLQRAKTGLTDLGQLYPSAVQNDYIPQFAFNGSNRLANTGGFGTNNAPFYNYNTTIEMIDNLSKVWNQHAFKAGIYMQRSRKDQTSFAEANGSYDFGDDPSNPYDAQFGFANAALGVYRSFSQASQYATGKYRYWNIEWYAQDTWKVTNRLTLDYGMRFYWVQPQYDSALLTSNFLPERWDPAKAPRLFMPGFASDGKTKIGIDPITGITRPATDIGKLVPGTGSILNGIAAAGKDVTKYLMKDRGILYSPRLGFAYDVFGTQKVVIRGGAGIMYDRYQGNEIFDELVNPPTTIIPKLVNGLAKDINPTGALLAPPSLNGLDYNGNIPTTTNYSFGIQSQLPFKFVLDTAYVGSLSRHLLDRINLNAIPYGTTFLPQNQDPTKVAATPNALLGNNALDANFLRPYPGFGDILVHREGGSTNYNSFQLGLNRRFSSSFTFGLAYTFGKALGTSTGDGDFVRIDKNQKQAYYGPLGIDRRQTVAINYIYDFPRMFRSNAWGHAFLDGWQISGLTRLQSGSPFSIGGGIQGYSNQNITGSYTEGYRPYVTCDPRTGSDDPYNRLNAACVAPARVGSIGLESGVNYLYGPGINNTDISLQKTFAVKERMQLQLRADAFNAFNHTQFSGYNTGVTFVGYTSNAITNAFLKADGTINNLNGFGTVSGARDPRIMQLMIKIRF
jgi:hypothetical protein